MVEGISGTSVRDTDSSQRCKQNENSVAHSPHAFELINPQGYKTRVLAHEGSSTKDLRSWSVPHLPRSDRSYTWRTTHDLQPRLMQALHYNQPDMTGISVCCNPTPVSFHIHTQGGRLPPYLGAPRGSTWTYIPFAAGERIHAIWMRHRCSGDSEHALMFQTSRTCIPISEQGIISLPVLPWSLIASPEGRPSSFFFDLNPIGTRELVFDAPVAQRPRPVFCSPRQPYPGSNFSRLFLWSSASLASVVSLRQCFRQHRGRCVTIGLEFCYSDGSAATVGEIRLDRMGDIVAVSSPHLWLGFRSSAGCWPAIYAVEVAQPAACNNLAWVKIPWIGRLVWWYSAEASRVWYESRTSPSTRLPNQLLLPAI